MSPNGYNAWVRIRRRDDQALLESRPTARDGRYLDGANETVPGVFAHAPVARPQSVAEGGSG